MSGFAQAGTQRRLMNQYQDSPRLSALLESLIDEPSAEIRAAFESLYTRLSIDESRGVQLDRIGYIVGQARPGSLTASPFEFIDADPNDPDKGFGSTGAPGSGGAFAGVNQTFQMTDADYRILLRAAIYRNSAGATIPDLERYAQLVVDADVVIVPSVGRIDVGFTRTLSTQERQIIEETMRPAAGIALVVSETVATAYSLQALELADGEPLVSMDGLELQALAPVSLAA